MGYKNSDRGCHFFLAIVTTDVTLPSSAQASSLPMGVQMANRETTFSYFVICVDYGRRGQEAIVNPEMTRLGAIAKVREIIGDGNEIAFAHRISMNEVPEDVKAELIAAAKFDDDVEAIGRALDRQAAQNDHRYDLRKHFEVA